MKSLTKSKHSTGSDTVTKKSSRWFRISSHRGEIEQLFDLYWGGKERRITGLTLRILGVNVVAVIALVFGVVYLGQYHATLIETKLERFETEVVLVSAAVTEGVLVTKITEDKEVVFLSLSKAKSLSARIGATLDKRILIFNPLGEIISDTKALIAENKVKPIFKIIEDDKQRLQSVEVLKDTAAWIASVFPQYNKLPLFPDEELGETLADANFVEQDTNELNISVWKGKGGHVILTATMPILSQTKSVGSIMIVSDGADIREALADTWFDIVKIFLLTLFITILLSIYLSGVIAKPLRKLAVAAENVRRGKLKYTEIPDMSNRNDEIGELSIVLKDMTYALWERMDSIEAFAADVSHEIKNPLTSLKSAVETAGIVSSKEDRDKLLEVIKHDIERLDRLITDISNASRLDAELSRETFALVDLKAVLRHIVDAYKRPLDRENTLDANIDYALKDGVKITLTLPDNCEHMYVRGSEGRLVQVLQNVLSNALSFSSVHTTIRIMAEVKSNRVTIAIEDEGPGIPEGKLKDIFERFYSERPEYEEYGRHSGLGLSICRQIITAHNGIIYAENRKDRSGEVHGARFIVVLNIVS
ncbi:MAG: HAMP domain-containing sensor histidine kinase [Alphaproteobacteria bacterium]